MALLAQKLPTQLFFRELRNCQKYILAPFPKGRIQLLLRFWGELTLHGPSSMSQKTALGAISPKANLSSEIVWDMLDLTLLCCKKQQIGNQLVGLGDSIWLKIKLFIFLNIALICKSAWDGTLDVMLTSQSFSSIELATTMIWQVSCRSKLMMALWSIVEMIRLVKVKVMMKL